MLPKPHSMTFLLLCLCLFPAWNGTALCSQPPPPKRIVSLAPAMTEMLFALGLGKRIVGVTSACDRPAEARGKAKIGGMANPSIEAIVALKPDLVVMNTDGNPKAVAERLAGLGIKTFIFRARRLGELPAGIREMGRALGAQTAADLLAAGIETAMQGSGGVPPGKSSPTSGGGCRKALFVIWPAPLIVAGPGTILDDAMRLHGLCNIAADAKVPYPRFSLEAVMERRPDLILIGKGHADMKRVSGRFLESLSTLEAVKRGRVCYMDDALYRPGPRIPAGMAELDRCGRLP